MYECRAAVRQVSGVKARIDGSKDSLVHKYDENSGEVKARGDEEFRGVSSCMNFKTCFAPSQSLLIHLQPLPL
jgi:hypothetical protein